MPATECHQLQQQGPNSHSPFSSFGRTLFSLRRDTPPQNAAAMLPPPEEAEQAADLEASFQRRVAGILADLRDGSGEGGDGVRFLSAPWLRRLLEAFLLCQDEFRALAAAQARKGRGGGGAQAERLAAEFHERAVKLLDVCNAARDGVDQVRRWARLAGIAASVILAGGDGGGEMEINEGQLRRARKALADLSALLADASSSAAAAAGAVPHRNRSFGRASRSSPSRASSVSSSSSSHFRSLSWSVSRSWSAARQLQAIGAGLGAPPRTTHEAAAAHAMGCVLHLTAWALVAAVPCPDRAAALHHLPNPPPRAAAYPWAPPLLALVDRLAEEGKRKDSRRNSGGSSCGFLLREIHGLERSSRRLADAIDAGEGVREAAAELAAACAAVRDGLDPLERTVREVFRRVVRCRMEGLDAPLLAAE